MTYQSNIQADSEIFEKVRFIPVSTDLILKPVIPELLRTEAIAYHVNCNNPELKKYVPLVYVESVEQAEKFLSDSIQSMMLRGGLLYCIRPTEHQFPIGYISANSPLTPTGLNGWSVDFWMTPTMRNQGIMTASLNSLLGYLQQYQVPDMKALIHPDNKAARSIVQKLGFTYINEEPSGEKRQVYFVRLN